MRLNCIITHLPDEGGLAYFRRLAEKNWLHGWPDIARAITGEASRSAFLTEPKSMVEALGIDAGSATFAAEQEAQWLGWGALRRRSSDAVCPLCLRDAGYGRQIWAHAFYTACHVHRCQLIDRCLTCEAPLSHRRRQIGQCACGTLLADVAVAPASMAQVWLSTQIAGHANQLTGFGPKLSGVDTGAVCELVRTLCFRFAPAGGKIRWNSVRLSTVQQSISFLAPLDELLADWPLAFRGHVAQRLAAAGTDARTLSSSLGQWFARLKRVCAGSDLDQFVKAVLSAAESDFNGSMLQGCTSELASDVSQHLRLAQAASELGLGRDFLRQSIERKECAARGRKYGTKGLTYEVPLSEVQRISAARAEWVGEGEASAIAGVRAAVMTEMVAAGVVESDPSWRTNLLRGGPIRSSSVRELHERIQSRRISSVAGETVRWDDLSSRRMGDRQAIHAAMRAIADGEVAPAARGSQLGQIEFSREAVAAYFGTPVLEAGFSIQELSKLTGWKWESIAHWIDSELLKSEQIRRRGQLCRVVLPHHLLAFNRNYIPLSDLAKALEIKPSALALRLDGVERVGARPLSNGATRGVLIRLSDLARLALQP